MNKNKKIFTFKYDPTISLEKIGKETLVAVKTSKSQVHLHEISFANLEEAELNQADLRYTDLTGANLIGSDLSKANLSNANLRATYFVVKNYTRLNPAYSEMPGTSSISMPFL